MSKQSSNSPEPSDEHRPHKAGRKRKGIWELWCGYPHRWFTMPRGEDEPLRWFRVRRYEDQDVAETALKIHIRKAPAGWKYELRKGKK